MIDNNAMCYVGCVFDYDDILYDEILYDDFLIPTFFDHDFLCITRFFDYNILSLS